MGRQRGKRYQDVSAVSDAGVTYRARKHKRRKLRWPRLYQRPRKQEEQ